MIQEVLDLANTLINTDVQECKNTEILGAKGNSTWEGLVHYGLNRFALDLVEFSWSEHRKQKRVHHRWNIRAAMKDEHIHLQEI